MRKMTGNGLKVCQLCAVDFTLKHFLLPLIDGMYVEFDDGDDLLKICKKLALVISDKINLTEVEKARFETYKNSLEFFYSSSTLY